MSRAVDFLTQFLGQPPDGWVGERGEVARFIRGDVLLRVRDVAY